MFIIIATNTLKKKNSKTAINIKIPLLLLNDTTFLFTSNRISSTENPDKRKQRLPTSIEVKQNTLHNGFPINQNKREESIGRNVREVSPEKLFLFSVLPSSLISKKEERITRDEFLLLLQRRNEGVCTSREKFHFLLFLWHHGYEKERWLIS